MALRRLNYDVSRILKSNEYLVSLRTIINELIQNSIDAKARNITVKISTERFCVEVQDDGTGISCTDLNRIGECHVTSKLKTLTDLRDISTYGFRGEALYMILQSSHVTIITRPNGSENCWIRRFPDGCEPCEDFHHNTWHETSWGTVVKVSDLFYNFPVRREYLKRQSKSDLVDTTRKDVFTLLTRNPDINIFVYIDDAIAVRSENNPSSLGRFTQWRMCLQNVYGIGFTSERMKYVSASFREYDVHGVISIDPVPTKKYQFVTVNGRKYENPRLYSAINKAFHSTRYIESKWKNFSVKRVGASCTAYPIFAFVCSGSLDVADLIQSPDKAIIESNALKILTPLIMNIVSSFLGRLGYLQEDFSSCNLDHFLLNSNHQTPNAAEKPQAIKRAYANEEIKGNVQKTPKMNDWRSLKTITDGPPTCDELSNTTRVIECPYCDKNHEHEHVFDPTTSTRSLDLTGAESAYLKSHSVKDLKLSKSQLKGFEVIKQVDDKFILVRSEGKLLILDQHACHERVLVETLQKDVIELCVNKCIQKTDCNFHFEVSLVEGEWLQELSNELSLWGISSLLEKSHDHKYSVTIYEMPLFLHERVRFDSRLLKIVLLQHVYDLKDNKKMKLSTILNAHNNASKWWNIVPHMPRVYMQILNLKSCRSAIKFGHHLSNKECEILVSDLSKCKWPFHCAHGRPSVVPVVEFSDLSFSTTNPDYDIS